MAAGMNRMRAGLVTAAAVLYGCGALAEGVLGPLRWPIVGRPAVVTPGGALEVGVAGEGMLQLEGAGQALALEVRWEGERAGIRRGVCTLPETLAPGIYDLAVRAGDVEDRGRRAVHVVAEVPPTYSIALVRRAPQGMGGVAAPALPPELPARLAEAGVGLVIMMGPLAPGGTAKEFQALQESITLLAHPVFLCPSAADLESGSYEAYFGDPVYGVTYGLDGYLFLGAGLAAQDPSVPGTLGEVYRTRRVLRRCRWSTGVASRYGPDWNIRGQIALFADDPLDYLLADIVPPGMGSTVAWGKARVAPPPEIPRGTLLILDVNESGIALRQRPAVAE